MTIRLFTVIFLMLLAGSVFMTRGQADCGYGFFVQFCDIAGNTVAPVEVTAYRAKYEKGNAIKPASTGPDGYRFGGIGGCGAENRHFILKAYAPGYFPIEEPITLSEQNQTQPFVIRLQSKIDQRGVLRGYVLDQFGGAMTDTEVVFTSKNGYRFNAKTDANGYYQELLPAGSYEIRVEAPWFKGFRISNYRMTDYIELTLDICVELQPTPID